MMNLKIIIDKLSKNLIISHFNNNTKNYENSFKLDKIMNYSQESSFVFKNNYIDNISLYLDHYRVDYPELYKKELDLFNNYNNLDEIKESPMLFARKFDENIDNEIIDKIISSIK